jgi:diguanylate cyclase
MTDCSELGSMSITELTVVTNYRRDEVDALTGCLGRQAMWRALEEVQEPGCIVVVDLNAFMTFNDVHGHQAGDQVLAVIARRLRAGVGPLGTVYRWGGQEFGILLPRQASDDSARLVDRLLESVTEPIELRKESTADGEHVRVSATAGISELHRRGPDQSLRQAEIALHDAKGRRVPYSVFA